MEDSNHSNHQKEARFPSMEPKGASLGSQSLGRSSSPLRILLICESWALAECVTRVRSASKVDYS